MSAGRKIGIILISIWLIIWLGFCLFYADEGLFPLTNPVFWIPLIGLIFLVRGRKTK